MDPLEGVTVVENSIAGTGPYAGSLFGDLGAEVIKVERPDGGDPQRHLGKDVGHTLGGFGGFFTALNRNKKYVTVDLKSESGRVLYRDLVSDADLVIENFRPGKMDDLGVGFEDLREVNESLIYCSINGFARGSTYEDAKGSDTLIQAFSGAMSMTGEEGGKPVRTQVSIADISGSMWAFAFSLAALFAREFNEGGAQFVEVPMDESLIAWTWRRGFYSAATGKPHPKGNRHPHIAPCNAFKTADSYIMLYCADDEDWRNLCRALEKPELVDDERFESNDARLSHYEELEDVLEDVLATQPKAEWFDRLRAHDVPAAPVYNTLEVWDDPHIEERDLKVEMESELSDESIPTVRNPVLFDGESLPIDRPPRPLGADTDDVLLARGYSRDDIDELRDQNVI